MTEQATLPTRNVKIRLPRKLAFLLEMHPYKVLYGGRFGLKCLGLGTRVIMADGTLRAVEDVRAGESVMGPDSKPRLVLSTGRGRGPLYRVKQDGGIDYVVNDAHILSLKKSASAEKDRRIMHTGNPRSPNGRYSGWPKVTNIGVEQYLAQSERWRTHFRGYRAGCLQYPVRTVLIDPYFLGVWLGDGTGRELRITSADVEIAEYCEDLAMAYGGVASSGGKPGNKARDIGFVVKEGSKNPIWQAFKAYGLPNNKHIPRDYLSNHEEVRLQLLAGLIDTDGHVKGNSFRITQVNERLARDIKFLADGLGFRTAIARVGTICTNNGVRGHAWCISINGDTWRVPCLIDRKRIRREDCANRDFLLSGLKVESIGVGEWAGFTLDGDHLFCLEDGTVTHNSWSAASALVALGAHQELRIVCAREFQNSIDESVHALLSDRIHALGLDSYYRIGAKEIAGRNGTTFSFIGLAEHTAHTIKSYEGADVLLVEEGQNVSKRSWDMALPTIRKDGSEIWVLFNPDMETDDTYQRWVVNPPPGTVVVKTGWQDAERLGLFPEKENEKRLHFQRTQPDDYDNIWEGVPRSIVAGAIYAKQIGQMIKDSRIRAVPYDPRFPVHTVWDLGWNDAMVVIMVQLVAPSVLNIINYYEDNFRTYAEVVQLLNSLGYLWGEDWLPHDGANTTPALGKSPKQILQGLGRKRVKIIGQGKRPDPEAGINQARMIFPRVYIDNSTIEHPTGYLGGQRLITCLSRTARIVPKNTGEPAEQKRDEYKHGADAFRGLATIADQISNENHREYKPLPGFRNQTPGMGMLG